MTYRLNLYRGSKLTSTKLVEAPLEEAKQAAIAAIASEQAHRAELMNPNKAVVFQRWAVL